jgi:hypothetical protein
MNEPFVFPESPVDRFTVEWWTVTDSVLDFALVAHRAEYHVNTKWSDMPNARPGGADVVDDWMLYRDGTCVGRTEGWTRFRERFLATPHLLTRRQALEAAALLVDLAVDDAEERLGQLATRLEAITADLAAVDVEDAQRLMRLRP